MKYTNCSKNCPDYTVDCERFDCCECDYNPERIVYKQGYEDGAITELKKIKAEIREWYWQADKQKISEDPCVVDAIIDLYIRTVDNHISKLKGENK